MDDRIDWADVAAVGFLAARLDDADPIAAAIAWHALDGEDRAHCDAIAAALREAFEAGQREAVEENRALRRELAAWNAVAGWLRECHLERYLYWAGTGWTAAHTDPETDEPVYDAHGADMTALAAALGLEVEDE